MDCSQSIHYDLIPNYTMKCRLYPNKEMAAKIDRILYASKVAYNMALYDTFTNKANTKAWSDPKSGEVVHFPQTSKMAKAEYLNKLRDMNPIVSNIPAGALSGKNGLFCCDMQKMLEAQVGTDEESDKKSENKKSGKSRKNKGNKVSSPEKKKKAIRPIESSEPHYYSKSHPRKSYTYQQYCSSISFSENKNVLYINLAKVGTVKVRGWNQKIRFDNTYKEDFCKYVINNPKHLITVTVSKDNCGDYWICFKLKNIYKPINISNRSDSVGIDVGIKDIAILSNGTKFPNMRFKEQEKKHLNALNKQMSRRNGYKNQKFLAEMRKDSNLKISKRYENTRLSWAKLNRKIANRRINYYNNISKNIVEDYSFVGIESLNISGMLRNRHIAKSLSDTALYSLLQMIKYKSDWHGVIVQPIDRWAPSSKRCSSCGYIRKSLSLSTREWTCQKCGIHHDRDINAGKNILYYAKEIYQLKPILQ